MKDVVFVTGNPEKAENFSKHMGALIPHHPAELDEIQTLDPRTLVEHKARQAYEQIGKPVLVEDVMFVFATWESLPGPFIKFFVDVAGSEKMCRMLDGFKDRGAVASCTFGYYDGREIKFFEGSLAGVVADEPRGTNGYGFDRVFEPEGFGGKTAGELNDEEYESYYQAIKPFAKLKEFFK